MPLLTPRLGGKRQKDPCDTPCGFPSVSLSHLHRLVCKQGLRASTWGPNGAPGEKGPFGKLSLPPSLPPTNGPRGGSPQIIQQFCKRAGQGDRLEESYFVLMSLHPSGTLTSSPPIPKPMSVPDKGTVFLSSPPHSLHQITPNIKIQRLELLASGARRRGLA